MQINNMKWYLFIGALVVIIAAGLYFAFSDSPKTVSTTSSVPELPVGGSITPVVNTSASSPSLPKGVAIISFDTPSGATITVSDFIHNNETVPDTANPGSYVLAGDLGYCLADGTCPKGASVTDFSVSYDEKTHFFNIILLAEPLGTSRLNAEQFVESRLGISGQQACSLNYYVGTPYWVNSNYDNKNLGFSFCPGATVLPK